LQFDRIRINPGVATGKGCIRDLRFPVSRLLGLLAASESRDSILKAFPYLEPEDIEQALQYAVCLVDDEVVDLRRDFENADELRTGMRPISNC
jgi:uncharacterized protein (DUF433 family)